MYVKEHPRLVNEIPRGSKRYKTIKKIRSASERANSTMKEDQKIIDKPSLRPVGVRAYAPEGVMNRSRANALAQMAAIALLLKRALSFIIRTTNLFRKLHETNDPKIKEKLKPPSIPKSIANLIQLE